MVRPRKSLWKSILSVSFFVFFAYYYFGDKTNLPEDSSNGVQLFRPEFTENEQRSKIRKSKKVAVSFLLNFITEYVNSVYEDNCDNSWIRPTVLTFEICCQITKNTEDVFYTYVNLVFVTDIGVFVTLTKLLSYICSTIFGYCFYKCLV